MAGIHKQHDMIRHDTCVYSRPRIIHFDRANMFQCCVGVSMIRERCMYNASFMKFVRSEALGLHAHIHAQEPSHRHYSTMRRHAQRASPTAEAATTPSKRASVHAPAEALASDSLDSRQRMKRTRREPDGASEALHTPAQRRNVSVSEELQESWLWNVPSHRSPT